MGLATVDDYDPTLPGADFDSEQYESQNLPRCMHSKQISESITAVLSDPINFPDNELDRLIQILNIYLENPTLLDSFLNDWISKISQKLLEFMKNCSNIASFIAPCKILYNFCKIRGYKYILKYFPNSIHNCALIFRTTLQIITKYAGGDNNNYDDNENDTQIQISDWTCRYIFILWSSHLIQNPFPLNRLIPKSHQQDLSDLKTLLQDKFLKSSGKEMQAASIFLSNYFNRSDCENELKDFFTWSKISISRFTSEYALGIATCLIQLGKRADDLILFNFIEDFDEITELFKSSNSNYSTSTTFEKLLIKINGKVIELKIKNSDLKVDLSCILSALKSRDTVVRWTCAKTIRRVCFNNDKMIQISLFNFLLSELGKELKSSSSNCSLSLSIEPSPFYIHAILLSIGQLFNYKIFPIVNEDENDKSLDLLIDLITMCLRFDQIKGSYSIGSFVRDAACYVIWSWARYSTHILDTKNVRKIIYSLTFMSLFDREVSCRRSASAALQEFIGRLSVKEMEKRVFVEILKHSDFFSVASLDKCFYSNSICIAKEFPEITSFFIENLLAGSLFNFDKSIRQMSAETIGILSSLTTDHAVDIDSIIGRVIEIYENSNDLFAIHGALLTMASLPSNLKMMEISCKSSTIPLKSLGYDLLLVGYLKLIESYARFGCIKSETVSIWFQTILSGLKSKQDDSRQAAVSTLHAITNLLPLHSELLESFYLTILSGIDKERDINVQKGYIAALSTVPCEIFVKNGKNIIKLLIKISKTIIPINDIEKRCSALDSLAILCKTYHSILEEDFSLIKEILVNNLLCDYSIDTRGDVGSKIRLSAIKVVESLSLSCSSCSEIESLLYEQIFGRLDRLRAPAMAALSIDYKTAQLEDLALQLFSSNKIVSFSGAFRGLIFSCGGLDRELSKRALSMIESGIKSAENVYQSFKSTCFQCIQASDPGDLRLTVPTILTVSNLLETDSLILSFDFLEEFTDILMKHVLEASSSANNIRKLIPSFTLLKTINPLVNGKYTDYLESQGNTHKFPTIRQLIKQQQ